MPNPVQLGRKTRMSFAKINEVAEMPNLIQIQTDSYGWFIEEGLREVFEDISPIKDYAGNLVLEFIDYSLNDSPKYEQEECKERDVTYAAPLKVKVRLVNKETGEVKEQEIFDALIKKVEATIKTVADAKGLSVVMDKNNVVYGGQDITDEVGKKLTGK